MTSLRPGCSRVVRHLVTSAALALLALSHAEAGAAQTEPLASPAPLVNRSLLLGFLADNSTMNLIDARSPEEYSTRHVTGAVNIPHDRLDEYAERLPADVSEPIVIYCRSGMRAGLLQEQLTARGYNDVRVLPPRQLFWTDEVMVFNCGVTDGDVPAPVAATAEAGSGEAPGPINRQERR